MTTSTKDQRQAEESRREAGPDTPAPRQVIGRFLDTGNGQVPSAPGITDRNGRGDGGVSGPAVAVFCHDGPDSYIGGHVARVLPALAQRGRLVHLFCREPFPISPETNIRVHVVDTGESSDLLEQVQQFARRAGNAFLQQVPAGEPVAVIGYEWTSAPVLSLLKGLRNLPTVLSLHSLERQRSDLSSDISRKIVEIEYEGIQTAATLLLHDPGTIEVVRQWVPSCVDRVVAARPMFPIPSFESDLDPGAVKGRYQVGPVDPMLLYIGDLSERYGPDALLRAMPAILRHHPQARLVIVGDGSLFWPLKVYTRYLLLEHAVRMVGHLQDGALNELVQAADVVVVPSRESTPWWPIQAAWAARKPVVATHDAARGLTEHEKDSVLVYPSENSIVWGVERVLYDEELRQNIGVAGRRKLEERFGWNATAEQLDEMLAGQPAR